MFSQTKIKSFYFETDQSVPTPYSQKQLELFKRSYNKGEITIYEIYSYTDSVGTTQYNDSLAKKRLRYVSTFLGLGNNTNVLLKPYGMTRKYDLKDYKSWRRVDIYYRISQKSDKGEDTLESVIEENDIQNPIPDYTFEDSIKNKVDPIKQSMESDIPYILNIGFIEGKSKIDDESYDEIKKLYNYLVDHPNKNILIRGHVCCGNNMRISKNRAKAVYRELKKMGIEEDRLDYIGLSNREPLVYPEKTNADRQRNRRVDVKFTTVDL